MSSAPAPVARALSALGSLRLTVAILGMSIFLVLAGTLAQRFQGNWTVVDQYFRCWIATVDLKIFFFADSGVQGALPFPGGKLLGVVLLANLLISHSARVRVQARGGRLFLGLGLLATGLWLTWFVISHVFEADSSRDAVTPSNRVTLQLMQGGGSAAVLFVGCWLLFRRKAGIVLLHTGIVILMLSELITGMYVHEGTMTVGEGQKVSFVEDTRKVELAIIDGSDPASDDVFVVPQHRLRESDPVRVEGLPIEVIPMGDRFMKNADLKPVPPGTASPATRGAGVYVQAVEVREQNGVSMDSGVDLPAVYVRLREVPGGGDLGTYLTSVQLSMGKGTQTVRAGGKEYRLALRFKRTYKPYSIFLTSFRFDRYAGTETAKDFSSFVRLEDPQRGTTRDVRIWMNNPLRYRGDTLYQQSFDRASEKISMLQVVDNSGWMAPYVACMIVAVGMLGQFQLHLLEFLRKRMGGGP